jgi:hypothetical protein
MLKFLTGAAAIALAASAALADPGGGKGGGGGGHGGGGGDDGGGGGNPHAQNGTPKNGGDRDRGKQGGDFRDKQGGGRGEDKRAERGGSGDVDGNRDYGDNRPAKRDRDYNRSEVVAQHGGGEDEQRRDGYGQSRESVGRGKRDRPIDWRWAESVPQQTRGLIAGCPPGLAKKNNGCLPPGLARGGAARVFYDSPDWWNFNDRWHDAGALSGGDYRYYDGYLVRSSSNGIASWLPLLGGALSPGNLWPSQYASAELPPYYQDYYGLGSSDGYRYYDDTLYRVDPQSQAITAITALLTGDSFQVGQRMPAGYDVYNVPYNYRDNYRDGADSNYRYSDGTIYQVDPTTQLVQAAIELLT